MPVNRPSVVVILAAGEGKRMRSATPKVLHSVAGRSLVGHVIEAASTLEPLHLVVVVGHGRDLVIEHVNEIAPWAITVVQEEQRGTGHAVRVALDELDVRGVDLDSGPVVVLTGDTPLLTGSTLVALMTDHSSASASATVLTAQLADPTGYGRVIRDASGAVIYRPTAHYAYHPCDDAVLSLHEFAGQNWNIQESKRLMMDEISSGMDELGVLLMGHKKGAYWYGSRLTIEDARALAPHNNATSLQVCAAVLAGVVFGMENPALGVMEADELDHARMLEICLPYLGEMAGVYSDWNPLQDRATLFPEELDREDPWQFVNFRVT